MVSRIFTPTLATYLTQGKVFTASKTSFKVFNAAMVPLLTRSLALDGLMASETDENPDGEGEDTEEAEGGLSGGELAIVVCVDG